MNILENLAKKYDPYDELINQETETMAKKIKVVQNDVDADRVPFDQYITSFSATVEPSLPPVNPHGNFISKSSFFCSVYINAVKLYPFQQLGCLFE